MNREQQIKKVEDHAGWSHGVNAILKQVFSTDTEVRVRNGGVHEDVEHAKKEVGRMSQEAEELLSTLNGATVHPIDEIERAFEAIVKEL